MKKFDVIINGGGFAGLSIAVGLARLGINIAIIEPQSVKTIRENDNDKRTTALSYATRQYFKKIGMWEKLSERSAPINDIKIIDADYIKGDSFLRLNFSSKDVEHELGSNEPMGHIIENYYLKNCLLDECVKLNNITFFEGQKISYMEQGASAVAVTLKGDLSLSAKLLVAADGRNSLVREMLKIETFDKDYDQVALTFNIRHEKPHNDTAIERFMPTGPIATLPMHEAYSSAIVWTVKAEQGPYYMKMSDVELKEMVSKRLNNILGDFEFITPRAAFPLKLKYAKEFNRGMVVLIADAAHAIHPIAGQGFNQGCKDINLLVSMIEQNLSLGLDIGDGAMLKKYEKNRIIDNKQMILATDIFNGLFSNDNKIATKGRRIGISAVDKLTPIKRFFIKRAMGA